MLSVLIEFLQLIGALLLAKAAALFIESCFIHGLVLSIARMPQLIMSSITDIMSVFWALIKAIVTVPIAILKLVVIAVIELPVKVLWATVPGLKTIIPQPSISKIFN